MDKEQLIKAIGITIGLFPIEIQSLLTKNGVVVDATNLNLNELVDATFNGLETSISFRNDFNDLYNANEELITSKLQDDKFLNLSGDNWTAIGTSVVGGLGSILGSKSNRDSAKAQADAMIRGGELSLEAQKLQLEAVKINAQKELALAQGKPQGNTMLYVALGIGGVLVLGVIIFAVTRKRA
jgi:hypothetical protein